MDASLKGNRKSEARSLEIQHQIEALGGRDLQLWSITALIILVLAGGFLAMVLPNLSWKTGPLHVEDRYLPQGLFGFITLIVLFNVYVISQKRSMSTVRLALIRELVTQEKLSAITLVDPLTQILNAQSLELVMQKEVARANRLGSNLSVVALSLNSLNSVKSKYGETASDEMLVSFVELAKENFRGSDTMVRYREGTILVVLPDTDQQQAEIPLRRIFIAADHWNLTSKSNSEITFTHGVGQYAPGADIMEVIRNAERKALHPEALIPVLIPFTNGELAAHRLI